MWVVFLDFDMKPWTSGGLRWLQKVQIAATSTSISWESGGPLDRKFPWCFSCRDFYGFCKSTYLNDNRRSRVRENQSSLPRRVRPRHNPQNSKSPLVSLASGNVSQKCPCFRWDACRVCRSTNLTGGSTLWAHKTRETCWDGLQKSHSPPAIHGGLRRGSKSRF